MAEFNKAVVFQAGKEEYAFPIQFVISIEKLEGMTAIPHMPNYVTGMTKVRGELIPVIDLEKVLYHHDIQADEKTKMIVINTEDISVGVLVKDAKEIIEIPTENLKQPGLFAYQNTNFITSVANFDQRLIMLVDPKTLVDTLEGIREIKDYMKNQQQESTN